MEYRGVGVRVKHTFTSANPNHAYAAHTDFVGMMNLYRKWAGTFTYPLNKKDGPKPAQASVPHIA